MTPFGQKEKTKSIWYSTYLKKCTLLKTLAFSAVFIIFQNYHGNYPKKFHHSKTHLPGKLEFFPCCPPVTGYLVYGIQRLEDYELPRTWWPRFFHICLSRSSARNMLSPTLRNGRILNWPLPILEGMPDVRLYLKSGSKVIRVNLFLLSLKITGIMEAWCCTH